MASRAGSSLLGVHSSLPLGLHRAHGDLATWVTSWMLAHRSPRTPGTPRPRSAQDRLARTRTFQDELLGPSQRAFRNRTRVHTLLPCRSHKHVCAKDSLRREGRRPRLNKQENRWWGGIRTCSTHQTPASVPVPSLPRGLALLTGRAESRPQLCSPLSPSGAGRGVGRLSGPLPLLAAQVHLARGGCQDVGPEPAWGVLGSGPATLWEGRAVLGPAGVRGPEEGLQNP